MTSRADSPAISVVVIVFAGAHHLARCLEGLARQEQVEPEVIVAFDAALHLPADAHAPHLRATLLAVGGSPTPAELRARAVALAKAPVIALLEDHCVPDPDWCARILVAHAAPDAAVGGCVEKGFAHGERDDSAVNWAIYLTDYSRYMPPLPAGPAVSLTDCNVSYKRSALDAIRDEWVTEFHENVVHDLLRRHGGKLWLDPRIVVREHRELSLRHALRDRYAFGRLFASTRIAGAPPTRRAVYAAAAVLLPPVLVWRAVRNLLFRRRFLLQIPRCLPALCLTTAAWMLGEMVGYATGAPAASLRPTHPATEPAT